MIRFAYTILYVKDVRASLRFYETAFGFQCRFLSEDHTYAELISGETTLSFASITLADSNLTGGFIPAERDKKPFGIEIGFTTGDVAATLKSCVDAGALLVEEPKTKPWGQVVAYVRDLDGFLIEICTPMI